MDKRRLPIFRLLGLVLGLCATWHFVEIWKQRAPLLEKYYLSAYARTGIVPGWNRYDLLLTRDRSLATPGDPGPYFERRSKVQPRKLNAWLKQNIYHDQPIWKVLQWPLLAGGFVLALLLSLGKVIDERSQRQKIARGPRMLSKWEFWRRNAFKRKGFYIETR
jgi:hypothetical protein